MAGCWLRVAAEGVSVTWHRARPVISCADFTVRKGEISRLSLSWVGLYLEPGFGKVGDHCLGILIL